MINVWDKIRTITFIPIEVCMADLRLMSGDSLARKHVVFIHGLGGNAETTWQSSDSEKVFGISGYMRT